MKENGFTHVYFQNDSFRIEGSVYYDSRKDTYMTNLEMIPDDCQGGFVFFTQDYATQKDAIKIMNGKLKTLINTIYAGVTYAI